MSFSGADLKSIQLIKLILEEFKNLSGLTVNAKKSDVFCSALTECLKK